MPSFAVPGGVIAALILLVIIAAGWVLSWRSLGALPSPRAQWLRLTRALSAVVLFLGASQPSCLSERADSAPGKLMVLVDASRSMSLVSGDSTRAALTKAWLAEQTPNENLGFATFGEALSVTGLGTLTEGYRPSESASLLSEAIAELSAQEDVGAVLVVSDGALAAPERSPLKVHTFSVGEAIIDDAVVDVRADEQGFLRTPAQVEFEVSSTRGERRLPVRLTRDGQLVREVFVELDESGRGLGRFSWEPRRLGRELYEVEVPLAGSDQVPENNVRPFILSVSRDRLRVLLVAGRPTWDVRFFREFLKRDPSIDLISFFILRSNSDLTNAPPNELALIPFPTDELFREHLGSFDVVVFQNFDFEPYEMGIYLPKIRDYVMRGGAFAMIGGDRSFDQGAYGGTPIASILPVRLLPSQTPAERALEPAMQQAQVGAEASRHPVVELRRGDNDAAWAALSPLRGRNEVLGVKEDAVTLLQGPDSGPLLVSGHFGEGRSLALLSDDSWRWGFGSAAESGDASAYERFWDRALRWLAKDPALDSSRIWIEAEEVAAGADVPVRLRARTPSHGRTSAAEIRLELRPARSTDDPAQKSIRVALDADGEWSGTIVAPDDPGAYEVRLVGDGEALAGEWLVVTSAGTELTRSQPEPETLAALSERTSAEHHALEDAPPIEGLDRVREQRLAVERQLPFASWPFLLVALLTFTGDWLLRRRWGAR